MGRTELRLPDGALVDPREALVGVLGRPEYANFLPRTGLSFFDADDGIIVVASEGRVCSGPLSLQGGGNIDDLQTVAVSDETWEALGVATRRVWRSPSAGEPGRGLLILADRGAMRMIQVSRAADDAVASLVALLLEVRGASLEAAAAYRE